MRYLKIYIVNIWQIMDKQLKVAVLTATTATTLIVILFLILSLVSEETSVLEKWLGL